MNKVARIGTAILLAGAMAPAFSAPPARPAVSSAGSIDAGQMEVGGLFAWFKSDGFDLGLLIVNGGYMFTDEFEAKLSWTALLGDASGGFINPGVDCFLPLDRSGVDPFTERWPVTLRCEGTVRGVGGIRLLDDTCATGVPGLYAVGDAATRERLTGAISGGGGPNSSWAICQTLKKKAAIVGPMTMPARPKPARPPSVDSKIT